MKNIRHYLFWDFDFLTGSKRRKHYNEIKKVYYQEEGYETICKRNLDNILSYACEKTSFYKNFDKKDIKSFPIIDKKTVNDNYEDFFSKDFSNRRDSLRLMTTSGSTGVTFKIFQDPEKVLRNKMDILFFYEIGNYNLGDRIYSMRIWTCINKKRKMALLKENFRMVDISNLYQKQWEPLKRDLLGCSSSKVIMGYASSLTEFMYSLSEEERKINWNIKSIFSGAEELPLKVKRELKETFNCPVMSRYSNQEMGMYAQQPITGEDYFLTNEASYYFEFLKLDSDEEAQEGEVARIIVTDLFNKAIPLIRYDTGDLCTFGTKNNRKYIKTIQGRANDLLKNNKGELFPPYLAIFTLWNFENIVQFQLTQESLDNVILKLVHKFENKEDTFKKIEDKLKHIFGDKTKVDIKEVNDIPIEKTGKRRYIISKVH